MFDFAWSEIALVGVVALIAIGPKDLPVAIKTVAEMVKKARKMAGEFQTHVDEMVREANLHEVRDTISGLRGFDIKSKILNAVDSDGALRKTVASNPFDINPAPPPVPVADTPGLEVTDITQHPDHTIAIPGLHHGSGMADDAPKEWADAGPPSFLPPSVAAAGLPQPPPPPPAFVPPAAVLHARKPLPRGSRYA